MNPINPSIAGTPAHRAFGTATRQQAGVFEKLATGRAIGRGSDNPAGLISSEALRAMLAELEAESRAFERATQAAVVADASLGAIGDLVIEAEAIAVANASTGGLSEAEREANQLELSSILQSVDRLAQQSSFGGRPLLRGTESISAGGASVDLPSLATTDLGETTARGQAYSLADLTSGAPLDTADGTSVRALEVIRRARDEILRARANVGAFVADDVEPLRRSTAIAIENTASAESAIRDADYAKETAEMVRLNALQSASLTAITVGPFDPSRLLSLLG